MSRPPEPKMPHRMMSYISCGVQQLFGFHNDLLTTLKHIHSRDSVRFNYPTYTFVNEGKTLGAFLIFSDNEAETRGLSAAIREYSLGYLLESEARRNPNSNRMIKVWVWAPDYDAIGKCITELEKKNENVGKSEVLAVPEVPGNPEVTGVQGLRIT